MDLGQSHANFFRDVMREPAHAAVIIGHFFTPEQRNYLRLEQLQLEDGTLIEESLREQRTDLLFTVPTATGKERGIWVLFEHKSNPDPDAPRQILRYMRAVYERQALPQPVIAVVFHHGERPWNVASVFQEYLEMDALEIDLFGDLVLNFRYIVADATSIDLDNLRADLVLRVFVFALREIRGDEPEERVGRVLAMAKDLFRQETGLKFIEKLLFYVYRVHDFEPENFGRLIEKHVGPKEGAIAVTTAEKLEQKGLEKGLEQGLEQGLEKGLEQGLLKGKIETASNMVAKGFPLEQVRELTGLSDEQLSAAGLL